MPNARLWLTEADLAKAARLHRSLGRGHRYWRDLLVTLPFVWLVVLDPVLCPECTVLPAAFVGAVLGSCTYLAWRSWRLLARRRDRKIVATRLQEVAWSEIGIATTTHLGTASYRWASLEQWTEDDGMFLLYRDVRTFQILPRRVFASFTEIVQMQNYLASAGIRRVGPKRR